ncbi:MAG TPA: START domain-containing protein [Puia sp.]|nr:START domain-containing protein [Puia sp.]
MSGLFFIQTILFIHAALLSSAQEDWKLKLEKEEIKIYTKPCGDSKIRSLKVVCTVKATLSQMAAVLLDIKSQDEWFYHTKSVLLKEISPYELYYHSELSFPFPFSNRDFIEHIVLSQNAVTRVVTMTVQNLPEFIPPQKDFVRVLHSECKWVVTPLANKTLHVEFTLFADPAGSIPVWLVNAMSYYGPFETFKKLKNQLLKPEYQDISLAFIRNE